MKILLLGAHGQLGTSLQMVLPSIGDVLALGRKGDDTYCGDLEDLDGITRTIRHFHPDVIVNAAAYTSVTNAEHNREKAFAINHRATAHIAELAKDIGALLVHYSTDYVFDGTSTRAYTEDDTPSPLNIYGASKLAGDKAIINSGCRHLILRSSWVYSLQAGNFLTAIIEQANTSNSLTVRGRQFGAPTSAKFLAQTTLTLIQKYQPELSGVYHATAAGKTTWQDYARYIVSASGQSSIPVREALPRLDALARPVNCCLDTEKIQKTFGIVPPDWQSDVARHITALKIT